ncbi:hypothetical protein SNE40_017230 [Patella caerulea]|uniref:Integrase catalytic domain-containing protein n=1 Tax=Patella caerulea TaxID=87958 RepID=A0AAN8JDG7_PATCE
MCSYYRRYFSNFSKLAEPLIALTRKNAKFEWTLQCENSFHALKQTLVQIPMLSYPNPNKPYILYTDASNFSVGAYLCQTKRNSKGIEEELPVYMLSHTLSNTQSRWSTIEKECYAIHYALQKLDFYLHDAEFIIRTDHKPLKYLLDSPMNNKKLEMWSLTISAYNCKIEYLSGKQNVIADFLSRMPTQFQEEELLNSEVNDNTLEINAINSNQFEPREFAKCTVDLGNNDNTVKPPPLEGYNMIEEQVKDKDIVNIIAQLRSNKPCASNNKYLLMQDVLHYISDPNDEPTPRLFVPDHLRSDVIKEYHDMFHLGIDKTYSFIKKKYYWPNLYKHIYQYVSRCVTCQKRSSKKIKPPLQETDIPPYPFAKVSLDLSGPYPLSLSGNKYIISFVDWYSGWPEAYAVKDKSADNVAHLLIDEIFPRYGTPLQLVTDNGSENENRTMHQTLTALNIHHITTSYYRPQSNSRVERFHQTMVSVLSKKLEDNLNTWDLYLNQTLAAIRFNICESSKFSPFYLLYTRDVVLPIDNLLKPRRKYLGEEFHQIALENQHKAFLLVHKNLKKAKRRQAHYADKNSKAIAFEVGDPVYIKNHLRKSKLQSKWKPFYRIITKTGPLSFIVKNQLDGSTTKSHAEHLRLANLDNWDIPTDNIPKLRQANYVVPPDDSSDDDMDHVNDLDPTPFDITDQYRRERDDSSDEDDIPLMELAKRLRNKDRIASKTYVPHTSDEKSETYIDDQLETCRDDKLEPCVDNYVQESMDVDAVDIAITNSNTHNDPNANLKQLLTSIIGMIK